MDGDDFVLDDPPSRPAADSRAPRSDAGGSRAVAVAAASTRPKGLSAAQKRVWVRRLHRVLRVGIQVMFFVLAPGLFAAAFNGAKYLFSQIGALQPLEVTSFAVVLVALLAFTVVFGRFFCGYACAFGALGDWMYAVAHGILSRTPLRGLRIPEKVMKALSLVKYGVVAAIGAACVLGVWAEVSGYSPWVAFAGFTSGSLDGVRKGAFVLLGACLVGMMLSERFFCRVLCPMGAVFALMPVLPFSSFTRTRAHCARKCGQCHDACPVDLWPDSDTLSHGECIACGRCVDACPLANVNLVAVAKPAGRDELAQVLDKANAAAAKKAEKALAVTREAAPAATIDVAEADAAAADGAEAAFDLSSSPVEEALARKSALREVLAGGRPVRKTRQTWHMLHGSGVMLTLVKAAVLLVLCWAVGVTRYLPSFGEVVAQIPWPF